VCRFGIGKKALATMGTAADMDNLAVATREYGPFTVAAWQAGPCCGKAKSARRGAPPSVPDGGTNNMTVREPLKIVKQA
jgi:hypothetical protein